MPTCHAPPAVPVIARVADFCRVRSVTYCHNAGAYYYYLTEANKTYEQTLLDVYAYAQQSGIPYRGVLLDSWWYFKGVGDGVKNWTAMPSIFPNGIRAVQEGALRHLVVPTRGACACGWLVGTGTRPRVHALVMCDAIGACMSVFVHECVRVFVRCACLGRDNGSGVQLPAGRLQHTTGTGPATPAMPLPMAVTTSSMWMHPSRPRVARWRCPWSSASGRTC